jgi:oligopeptide/dipeptide ABC transporter ATP-binding protein
MVPPLNALPQGCAFAPRCKRVMERCLSERPLLTEPAPGRLVACFAAEKG